MSAGLEIRLERLLGRMLVDSDGLPVGPIEDVDAQPNGDSYVVTHVLVGHAGRFERLREALHLLPTLRPLSPGEPRPARRLPWEWLDLTDPDHPRLRPHVQP
jgi:hypothetical protein